jgi:hypothetical protein
MNNLNPSRKPAARTRSGNLLALLLPAALEHFHQICSAALTPLREAVFLVFGRVLAQLQTHWGYAPSPKPCQKPKILASQRYIFSVNALILALLMLFLAGGATASAQVVTNTADSGPGTLRSALTNAASGAVITFDPSLSGATITLSNTLTINTNLTIDASALPGDLQINGNHAVQIFNVASTINVFLNSLTITNGYCTNNGGGIYNNGTLALNQCTLSGNSAPGGGGILNYNSRNLNGTATATITNTIVAGNSGSYGADIDNGADIYYYATLTYGGSNLVQSVYNSGGSGIVIGPAPLTNAPNLAPLGNYGGPTQTMPPLPGSSAIGAGSVAANTFSTDQRGYSRTQNGLIDIGAVEVQTPAANPPVLENIPVPAGGGANGLQFTFTNASAADFTVLTATNLLLALTNWTVLGEVQQVAPGQYQFTDPQAATNAVRFYRVRSP